MPQTFDSKGDTRLGDKKPHQQLSDMIEAGRGFSGGERNRAFLNTGIGRFADISYASGFDFPDDGRALIATDWDGDGDLDMFVSNRNAPRVRFLRNDSPSGNRHLALRLQSAGATPIGARVEVQFRAPNSELKTSTQTLRAGEAFLSQSSGWLHFGLGAAGEVAAVTVHWPGKAGGPELFTGISAGGRFLLAKGSGVASAVAVRARTPEFASSVPELPTSTRVARVPVVPQLGGTALNIVGPGGHTISTGAGKPTLLLLWASYCPACQAELRDITTRAEDIRAAGLQIIALVADDPGAGHRFLAEIGFPFASAAASEAVKASLQDMHDVHVGLHRPLPVPAGFLLDGKGRLAVIYKGGHGVDTLLADLGHAAGSRAERWVRAAALPGTTIDHPRVVAAGDLQAAALQFRRGASEEASRNIEAAIAHYSWALDLVPDFAQAQRKLGALHLRQRDWPRAAARFERLLAVEPDSPDIHFTLAKTYLQMGESAKARASFATAAGQRPGFAAALFELAALDATAGDAAAAVQHYRTGLQTQPAHVGAANNLAWLLATHPDAAIRNATEALALARTAVEATGGNNPDTLDTLAAAQAESGDLAAAIATAEKAIASARAAGSDPAVVQLNTRLARYRAGEPFRQAPSGSR